MCAKITAVTRPLLGLVEKNVIEELQDATKGKTRFCIIKEEIIIFSF